MCVVGPCCKNLVAYMKKAPHVPYHWAGKKKRPINIECIVSLQIEGVYRGGSSKVVSSGTKLMSMMFPVLSSSMPSQLRYISAAV